jgi:uncharacterized protein YkwD
VGASVNRHINRILQSRSSLVKPESDPAFAEQSRTQDVLAQTLARIGVLGAEQVDEVARKASLQEITSEAVKNAAGERYLLGALLVQSGHITNEQLDFAISEQQRTGEKLGEVFERCGLLTHRQLNALLDFQLSQDGAHASPLRLGELLVATGHLTRKQLESAILQQSLSHNRLGDVLVATGCVPSRRVKYGLRLQKMLLGAVVSAILSLEAPAVSHANAIPDSPAQIVMQSALSETGEFSCLSAKEEKLFILVNEYRESHGLPPIANSRSLNKVARVHTIDLLANSPAEGQDSRGLNCSLHSWSDQGAWKSVCYTKDHAYAEGMWDKPREITNFTYTGDGYENAYFTSEKEVNPARVLEAWKASPTHNAILLESGIWKGSNLLAFGVSIYKNYAVIWVGSQVDPLGPMQACGLAKD